MIYLTISSSSSRLGGEANFNSSSFAGGALNISGDLNNREENKDEKEKFPSNLFV